MQKLLNLKEWILETKVMIDEKLKNHEDWKPLIILIAWGSASGKTSAVAKKITDFYPENSEIISMDNYYRGHKFMDQNKELNFDQPEALNIELFVEHLEDLKNWKIVKIPEYDFKTEPVFDKIEIKPTKIIIAEWLFTLVPELAELGDLNIFVDIWMHGRVLRRIFRDVTRTGDKPQEILSYFLKNVEPMHEKYIEPTKKYADLVISNEYNEKTESTRANNNETRMKFNISGISSKKVSDIIHTMWGSYTWDFLVSDYFFNAKSRDLLSTGEILRIRHMWFNKYIMTYKWPDNDENKFDNRAIINFFVDAEIFNNFQNLYWKHKKRLVKNRVTYYLNWILICVDIFETGERFLDITFDDEKKYEFLVEFLEKLEIDEKNVIMKPYFEFLD